MKYIGIVSKILVTAFLLLGLTAAEGGNSCGGSDKKSAEVKAEEDKKLAEEIAKKMAEEFQKRGLNSTPEERERLASNSDKKFQESIKALQDANEELLKRLTNVSPGPGPAAGPGGPAAGPGAGAPPPPPPPGPGAGAPPPPGPGAGAPPPPPGPGAGAPPPPPPPGPGPGAPPPGPPPARPANPSWARPDAALFNGYNVAGRAPFTNNAANQKKIFIGNRRLNNGRFESLWAYFGIEEVPAGEAPGDARNERRSKLYYFGPPLKDAAGNRLVVENTPESRYAFLEALYQGGAPYVPRGSRPNNEKLDPNVIFNLERDVNDMPDQPAARAMVINNMADYERFLIYHKDDGDLFTRGSARILLEDLNAIFEPPGGGAPGGAAGETPARQILRDGARRWLRANVTAPTGENPDGFNTRFTAVFQAFLENRAGAESFENWYARTNQQPPPNP